MSAYFVIDLSIPDAVQLNLYERLANPVLKKHGAEVLTRGAPSDYDVIEGSWSPRRIVVIKYPSRQAIHGFYHDPEYLPAKEVRLGVLGSMANALAIDGVDDGRPEAVTNGSRHPAAYFVIDLTISDAEKLEAYEAQVDRLVDRYNGRFLVRGGDYDVIEGIWRPQKLIIEKYASRQTIHDMFDDPQNQPLKMLRRSGSRANALAIDGVPSSSLVEAAAA